MELWTGLDRTRLVSSILAWCICCTLSYAELKSRDRAELRRIETERQLAVWKRKVDELNGQPEVFEQIAQIPSTDKAALTHAMSSLRKLVAVQQVIEVDLFFMQT